MKRKSILLIFLVLVLTLTSSVPVFASDSNSYRYLVVEVNGIQNASASANGSAITEIQAYDSTNTEILHGLIPINAYDSTTKGVPSYWNDSVWGKSNLTNGNINYVNNSTGMSSATLFNYNSTDHSGCWARFAFDLYSAKSIDELKLYLGSIEGRVPKSVIIYGTNYYSTSQVSSQRDNTNLVLLGTINSPNATTVSPYNLIVSQTNLSATAGNAQVNLTWNAVTGATSYNVQRSITSGGPYTSIATNVTSPNYADTSVTNGTTYYYVITAVNDNGESAYSNEVSATPQALLPSSPTNLVATAGTGQVSLTWDAVANATGYNVKRATTAGGPYTSIADNISATSYTDASVAAGATYYYVVTALTDVGESANSNEASATLSTPAGDRLYVLLDLNEQAQLSVTDNLTDNTTLTWTSSDPSIATVDANGKVTALKEGTCFINVANSDNTYTDYIPIKVMKGAANYRLALHLKAGDSKRLWITDNASSVMWTSMDTSVASIDSTGKVTAVANGLCIVQGELNGKTYLIYVRVNS